MAKGAKQPPTKVASSKPSAEANQVNLTEGASLKRALDEAVAEELTSSSSGYTEDHFVSNVKIGISLVLCSLAALAQFWPQKFPENWTLLLVCVILYGLGTAVLTVFTSLVEKDAFLFLKPQGAQSHPGLRVTSKLSKLSYNYELLIAADNGGPVSMSKDIRTCFSSDGYLVKPAIQNEVKQLLESATQSLKKLL